MMKKENFIKSWKKKFLSMPLDKKIILTFMFVFFTLEVIIHLYPLVWALNNSLKEGDEFLVAGAAMKMVKAWRFENYLEVFDVFTVKGSIGYGQMLWNSIWQCVLYLIINLASSTMVAYILSKYNFPGKSLLFGLMIFTQTIPIVGSGVANYKLISALGMINNPTTIWIAWAMGFDYSAFVMYGTFQSISNSYRESAELDGANNLQVLWHIMLPQIIPCILALAVTNFVTRWNDYTTSQIYLNEYPNLAYGLFIFESKMVHSSNGEGIYYASLIISAIPGILIYAFSQNAVIKNVSVGGLKG